MRLGNGSEPQGLDPHTVTGVPEHRLLSTLFEGLVDADAATLTPKPGVAESWDISPDGRVYTFHLRDTALWSNGEPVTADDFVYAWRRILTPTLAAEYAYMLYCIDNAQAYNEGKITDFDRMGVKALDARTLRVTLTEPTPYFLALQIHSTYYPVHRATIEKYGAIDTRNTRWTRPGNLVGNGAFVLTRWIPNNIIEVTRNDRYWNRANVRLERIQFYPIENGLTEERSFRTGLLDLTESIPIQKVPAYRRNNPQVLRTDPYLGTYFYRVNVTKPPFNDVRVRRAFSMAMDRETIVTRVMTGGQRPAYGLTVPDPNGYTCASKIPYDPEGARRLLAEAGYPEGRGLPVPVLLYNTNENHKLLAEALQRMWKETLGVDVSLVNQDWKVYMDSQRNLDYNLARAGWIGDVVDPINFLECFVTGGGNNNTGWSSPRYDELLAQSRRTPDQAARFALFQEAEKILLEESPMIPLYYYTRAYLISPRVENYHDNLLGYISFKELTLKEAAP